MVPIMVRPRVPPISCTVEKPPEATAARSLGMEEIAAVVDGPQTRTVPIPKKRHPAEVSRRELVGSKKNWRVIERRKERNPRIMGSLGPTLA